MTCATCGMQTHVIDSRVGVADTGGYVRRRRACTGCGKRATSVELFIAGGTQGKKTLAAATVSAIDVGMHALDELREMRSRLDMLITTMEG